MMTYSTNSSLLIQYITNISIQYYALTPGVDLGFCVTSSRVPLGTRFLGGSGGMLPRKILKSRVSEMAFSAFWRKILPNSDGQNLIHK